MTLKYPFIKCLQSNLSDFKLTLWFESEVCVKMDASGANTLAWTRPVYLVKFKVTSRLLVDSHVLGWTQVRMDIPV